MQDYNYVYAGCIELTLELSCCKYPNSTNLLKFWNENKIPLLSLLTEAHKGVKGIIKDTYSEFPIAKANITILGRDIIFQSDKRGQFWRLLMPGDYVIIFKSIGYKQLQKQFTVTDNKITIINAYMVPERRTSRTVTFGNHSNDTSLIQSEKLLATNSTPSIQSSANIYVYFGQLLENSVENIVHLLSYPWANVN